MSPDWAKILYYLNQAPCGVILLIAWVSSTYFANKHLQAIIGELSAIRRNGGAAAKE